MLITKHSIYNNIKVGPRYIYYSSLLNDNPSLASSAQSYLTKHLSEIQTSKTEKDSENKMTSIIKLLEQALIQEQRAEIQFLKTNFLNNPLFLTFPNFHDKISKICNNTESFDYTAVTAAINLSFQGLKNFISNIQIEQKRHEILQQNIKKTISSMDSEE